MGGVSTGSILPGVLALVVAACDAREAADGAGPDGAASHSGLDAPGARAPGWVGEAGFARFEAEVLPVLETRCGVGCHAVDARRFAEHLETADHPEGLWIPLDPATGRVPDDDALRRLAYDVARGAWTPHHAEGGGHGTATPRIDRQAPAAFSPLLRHPLAEALGGLPHAGLDVFSDLQDPGYLALLGWVEEEIAASPEPAPEPTAAQAYFRDAVVQVLDRNGCFLGSCHGANVFNDLKLQRPLPRERFDEGEPLRLSPRMLAANRRALLGEVARFANLGGALEQSRLIAKALPVGAGGVHHRGGNLQFLSDLSDPDAQILLQWMRLERQERAAHLTSRGRPVPASDLGRVQGVVFLRGPRHAPRAFFDADAWWPGTRLMLLPEGASEPVDLLPDFAGEIQGLDVRYDARAVVISARRSADEGFRLYELELDDRLQPAPGGLRPLSAGPARRPDGRLVHHLDPIYVPGPDDDGSRLDVVAVAFASNAAGAWAASEPFALLGEADGGEPGVLVDAERHEVAGTFNGRRLHVVDGPMADATRTIVRHEAGGRLVLDRALPEAPDRRTVYEIEVTQGERRPAFDIWRMVPGAWEASARPMTFTAAQERRPTTRTTGEVMFTSVRNRGYQGDRPVYNGAIYRVMTGGFDYHIQGGNRSRHALLADSRELPSGLEIRLALDPRNLWGGGAPQLADHGFGVNIEPENPVDDLPFGAGQRHPDPAGPRFLPTQVPLLPEHGAGGVAPTGWSPGGSFRDPWPDANGTIWIAHAAGPLDHLDPDADPDWDVYRLRFDGALQSHDGLAAGPVVLERLDAASTADQAETSPRPLVVRLKEPATTHQKFHADLARAPVSDHGVLRADPAEPGEIECYDYRLLQSFLTTFTPVGARDFREEELAWVRIVQQTPPSAADVAPARGAEDPWATATGLGVHTRQSIVAEIPIEADGSFYARVPPEVPLLVQGLDRDRRALHSMNRWFYVQPGEKLTFSIPASIFPTRCSGCHGALTGDPTQALGPPDVVSAASRVMATWDPVGGDRRPAHPPEPVTVDYRRDVQPIFDAHCTRCHGQGEATRVLDLRGDAAAPWTVSYRALHALEDPASGRHARKRYLDERQALSSRSFLLEKLTGEELDAPQVLDRPGTPHPADAPLAPADLLTLSRWIDLGATFLGGEP